MRTTPEGDGRWSLHGAFATELRARVEGLAAQVQAARDADDDVLVGLLTTELDNLVRLAERNGIDVPRGADTSS